MVYSTGIIAVLLVNQKKEKDMSQQAAKRRRTQSRNGYKHLAPRDRPNYKKTAEFNIHQAIDRERRKAARMAASKKGKS